MRKVSVDAIAKAVNKLGGSLKIYAGGADFLARHVKDGLITSLKIYPIEAVKKEIIARIPLKKYRKIELCIYLQEPFTRMVIFEQGKYEEVEREAFNLPQIFVSIWLEDLEGKKHIGQSLIPRNPDFTYLELSEPLLQKEVYEESRELVNSLIRLLSA